MHHGQTHTGSDHDHIVDYNADHTNQRADARFLCGIGLLILPYQEQDQTNQRNAAAQNSQEAAQQQTESGNSESGDTDNSSFVSTGLSPRTLFE